jgi:protoheme IX farnesyltransferase
VNATSSASSVTGRKTDGTTEIQTVWRDLSTLTKARLSLMVVFTTTVGYWVGAAEHLWGWGLFFTVLGTSLAAASAAVLNQVLEIEVDGRMERTRKRPLPMRRVRPRDAILLGVLLGISGLGVLWICSTPSAAVLGAATILIYLFGYTPLKKRSAWCTWMGAVSGAIPPVIGWAGTSSTEVWFAWVLFGILFLWQIPHFLAIAWLYRHEYENAGLVMISKEDESGIFTAIQTVVFSLLLCALAAFPLWKNAVKPFYGVSAGVVNLLFLGSSIVFLLERSRVSARRLFFTSILYLPVMLILFSLGLRR